MFDLAVIGMGSAGIEAISVALKNGLSIVAFEENELGGTCLNRGCIPTKAILHSANLYQEMKNSDSVGINAHNVSFDWEKILSRKSQITEKFQNAIKLSLSKKITIVNSKAKINIQNDEISIFAADNTYMTKNLIIATGSVPFELPDLKFDKDRILNSDDMYNLNELPNNVVIIGSGAIGLEWAEILSDFEKNVTIIEKAPTLAPNMDIDIQKRLERILKTKKISFYKNDFVSKIDNNKIILNSKKEIEFDKILVAVGRKKILPESNVEIKINDDFSTNFKNIFTIGDCSNSIMLAHNASWQARKVVDKILFNKTINKKLVPSAIYITPEIASIGIKEQDIENKEKYKISKFMVPSIAKSWCDNAVDGFVKVILKDDIIVGAHIVSKNAVELISIFNILIQKQIKKEEITDIIFPHPSYSEMILELIKNV